MSSIKCSGTALTKVTIPTNFIGMVILFINRLLPKEQMKGAAEVIRVYLNRVEYMKKAHKLRRSLSVLSENERRN